MNTSRRFRRMSKSILEKMRQTIKRAAPEAEETIRYQIPTFKLKGISLVHFAPFRKHIGLYPPAPKEFKKAISSYEGRTGNPKFPTGKPIRHTRFASSVLIPTN